MKLIYQAHDFTRGLKRDINVMMGDDLREHFAALDALHEELGEFLYPDGEPQPEPEPILPPIEVTATEVERPAYQPRKGMVWDLSPPDPPSA